jgi:Icc protein
MTDLHLGPSTDYTCRNVVTFESLKAVISAIECDGRGDHRLLLTGDISSNGRPESYQLIDQLLLAQRKQALWLPGNHDLMDVMKKNLKHFPFMPNFEINNWAMIMLDSSVSNQPEGLISQGELQRLRQFLDRRRDKNILVAMHHSPVAVNSLWVDKHRIANHSQLHQLLASHGKVRAVIHGHIHQQHETDWDGISVYSTPSTCFQFKPGSSDFALGDQPPAYRWLDLYDNGKLETGVRWLHRYPVNQQV